MRGTINKKARNKYAIRRRIAVFSILVCILGIFLITNKEEKSILGVSAEGQKYTTITYEEDEKGDDITIKYEYMLSDSGNVIVSCKVTIEAETMSALVNIDETKLSGWETSVWGAAMPIQTMTKEYTTNTEETLEFTDGKDDININVNRIDNHIITLSNENLYNAVVEAIESRYGSDIILGRDDEKFMLEITEGNLSKIIILDISGKNVTDVTGIDGFTNLKYLYVGNDFVNNETINSWLTLNYNYTTGNADSTGDIIACIVKVNVSGSADTFTGEFYNLNPQLEDGMTVSSNTNIEIKIPEETGEAENYKVYTTKVKYIQSDYSSEFLEEHVDDNGWTITYKYSLINGYIGKCSVVVDGGVFALGEYTNLPEGWYAASQHTIEKEYLKNTEETLTFSNLGTGSDSYDRIVNINVDKIENASSNYYEYFTFEINEDGKTATITGITASFTEVVIPYEVTDTSGNTYSVTSIGNSAFRDCISLSSITIPSSVTSIRSCAFYGCTSLSSINIPDSVTSIGSLAFYGCTSLSSITIPSSVMSIVGQAFSGCSSLSSITVDENNTVYDSRNGSNAIIKTATNTLVVGCKNTIIPESVTSIESNAFEWCTSLSSINIPDSVTSIGNYAFRDCISLSSITIPSSVTSIESYAFRGWTESQTIYCQFDAQPSTWDEKWDSACNAKIVWNTLVIKTLPKTTYIKGEELDLTGLVLEAPCEKSTITVKDDGNVYVSTGSENEKKYQSLEEAGVEVFGYDSGRTGEQELTVTYDGMSTTFTVEVTNKVTKLEIVQNPKTTYAKGEELELGDGKIKITFEDGTEKEITMDTNGVKVEGYDASKVGTQTVTVSYKGQGGATFTVEVTNKVTGIAIHTSPKTEYIKGEDLDLSDAKITVTYEDGTSEEKDITKNMVSGYDKTQTGTQTITITYEEKTATFDVNVKYNEILPSEVDSLEITGDYKKDYKVGDEVDLSEMVINATCKDGTSAKIEITKDGVKITCDGQTKEYSDLADAGIEVSPATLTDAGKQNITVTYGGKSTTFEVNVAEANKDEITGAELQSEPTKTEYTEGETLDLSGMKIEVTYADGSKETIEFKKNGKVEITHDGEKTEYYSAADAGITVLPSTLEAGTYDKIEITYKDQKIELPVSIQVNKKGIEVTGISLNKTEVALEVGKTVALNATITPTNATDKNVTWSSSDESVAVVSSSGVVTAKAAGTATITVTSDANPSVKAEATITVTASEATKVAVTGISLNKSETTIKVGQMEDLVCTITPTNATNKNVKWTSSDEEKVVVDENGTILALEEGQVTITVTSEDGGYTATCIVNVEGEKQDTNVKVTAVTLDKSEATIKVGATEQLVATILPENATNKKVMWSSSDETVATVTGGIVTAHKAGKATITVTTEDGNKTATCEVTVEENEVKDETVAVTGVALNKSKTTIEVGNTESLTATITPEDATNKNVTWTSSDESVVSVKGGVITALKEGTATITVATEDGNKTATCEVTVEKAASSNNNDDSSSSNSTNTNTSNTTNTDANTSTNTTDTSPVILPATGKGMIVAVIALIAGCGVVSFIKYKNIDR